MYLLSHSEPDEILPEEYVASYRRLVGQDFPDTEGGREVAVRNAPKDARKGHQGLFDVQTRINVSRDSMDEDEDFAMPVNFTAIGCILLEFTNALSKHMVSWWIHSPSRAFSLLGPKYSPHFRNEGVG